MKVRPLLLLGQLPLWLALVFGYAIVEHAIDARAQAIAQANLTRQQSAQLARALQTVIDMETGVRGYVVAGREEFLNPYNAGRSQLPTQLLQLRKLAATAPDSELSLRDIDRIDALSQRWLTEVAEPEIAARRLGNSAEARRLVSSGRGKEIVDAIRTRVTLYETREQNRLTRQEAEANRQLLYVRRNLLGLGAVLLLLSVLAALGVGNVLSRGFEQLKQAVGKLALGGEKVEVHARGLRELRDLSASFNHMSDELTHAQAEAKQHASDLTRRNEQMRSLGELSDWLQAARNLDEGAAVLGRAMPTLFPGTSGVLMLHNASRNLLVPLTSWGQEREPLPTVPDHCWSLRRGEARFPGEGRFAPPCLGLTPSGDAGAAGGSGSSYICFPLFSHGEMLGVLRLNALPGVTDSILSSREELRQLLVPLTRQVGLALAALQLQDRLRQQSLRDPLTGLANRRHLEQELAQHAGQAEAGGAQLSLIAVDVDHFKRLNDTFGHDAGDAVLVRLGATLRSLTPPGGLAARPGGEEFTLLLPGHSSAQARDLAERLRLEVEGWTLTHAGIALGQITVSQGVSTWGNQVHSTETLVKQADEALYRAKGEGRNRVALAGEAETVSSLTALPTL